MFFFENIFCYPAAISFTVSKTKCVDGDMIMFIFGLSQKFQICFMKL